METIDTIIQELIDYNKGKGKIFFTTKDNIKWVGYNEAKLDTLKHLKKVRKRLTNNK